jgi:ABC-type glycerol-3-phosphate transport system substrate-binding protein
MDVEYTPALQALMKAEKESGRDPTTLPCDCHYVDIGIGMQKVAQTDDCPQCTPFGFAWWAVKNGTDAEKPLAQAYLDEVLGPPVPGE